MASSVAEPWLNHRYMTHVPCHISMAKSWGVHVYVGGEAGSAPSTGSIQAR